MTTLPRARVRAFLAAVAMAAVAAAPDAHAAGPATAPDVDAGCEELPCSVIRSCSSTGMACETGDRACADRARSQDLEVRCEQTCARGQQLVYCPPDTGRSDSNVVWILLSVAVLLASVGGTVLWLALRKKDA